jgi:hypothetical protein
VLNFGDIGTVSQQEERNDKNKYIRIAAFTCLLVSLFKILLIARDVT